MPAGAVGLVPDAAEVVNPSDKTAISNLHKALRVPWEEGLALVDSEVGSGPVRAQGGAHCGPNELQEIDVPEFEVVVVHHDDHGRLDGLDVEVLGEVWP